MKWNKRVEKSEIRTWHIQTLYWLSPLSALVAQRCDRWGFFDQKKPKNMTFHCSIWSQSKSYLIITHLKPSTLKVIVTFCGTCPAGTHWDQSLSPASGSVYSAHTHSAWMCRRLARRWEPWNCCHNSHNRVQQSITNLCKKGEKWSFLCIIDLYLR